MAVADISFQCPHCAGPLIAEAAHVGLRTECPHCYRGIEIPKGVEINKNHFQEPLGLRRVLQQVRDQEWEIMRRELRAAKARNAKLEADLSSPRTGSSKKGASGAAECEALRKQLGAVNEQMARANAALATNREQHEAALSALRSELEQSRTEVISLRAAREASESTAEKLRQTVRDLEVRLEVETAKVFLMEAANGGSHAPPPSPGLCDRVLVNELQLQVADLRKANYMLQQSRDGAKEELARLRGAQGEAPERSNLSLGTLPSSLQEPAITSNRSGR